jgi:hypothetical protein
MPHVDYQPAPLELVATDDREKLAKRGADPLASFIVNLAHDSSGVGDLVRAYIALDIPKVSARIVRDSVERLRKSERDYDYRHRRGSEFVRRVATFSTPSKQLFCQRRPLMLLRYLRSSLKATARFPPTASRMTSELPKHSVAPAYYFSPRRSICQPSTRKLSLRVFPHATTMGCEID